jgi:protein O-GlcNAc transferase
MLQAGAIDSSEASRDQLLAYAHTLYANTPYSPTLLELLHLLNSLHPTHLPTLLLIACVYFTQRNYQASLHYNQLILKQDPQYVEAMSNIGTTLRSMGRTSEAEQWWYQAVKLRPGYWDAVENLVGVLCSSQSHDKAKKPVTAISHAGHDDANATKLVRYKEALNVCDFVEQFFFKSSPDADVKATTIGRLESAIKPPKDLAKHQIPRLQNLFYAKGNLKYAMGDMIGARHEYEKVCCDIVLETFFI